MSGGLTKKSQREIKTNRRHRPGRKIQIILHQRDDCRVYPNPMHEIPHLTQQEEGCDTGDRGKPQALLKGASDALGPSCAEVLGDSR